MTFDVDISVAICLRAIFIKYIGPGHRFFSRLNWKWNWENQVRGVGWQATKLREPELETYNKIKISRKLSRLKVLIGAHRAFQIFTPDFFVKLESLHMKSRRPLYLHLSWPWMFGWLLLTYHIELLFIHCTLIHCFPIKRRFSYSSLTPVGCWQNISIDSCRCAAGHRAAAAGAQQQMRVASCWEPTCYVYFFCIANHSIYLCKWHTTSHLLHVFLLLCLHWDGVTKMSRKL